MKKQFLKITMLLALPFVFALQSCSEEEEESKNTATVSMGSATITGRITADLILNNGQKEGVQGVKVVARINTSDLITTGNVNAAGLTRAYEAVTNANGEYTLTVEANSRPVNVSLEIPQTFNQTQTLENGTTRPTVFNRTTFVPTPVTITRGQVYTQNADYNYNIPSEIGTIKISGEVFYRNNLCKGISVELDSQIAVVPANTALVITWNDDNGNARESVVNVDANGKYEFTIETANANKTITIRGRKFYADRNDIDGNGDCVTETGYGYTRPSFNVNINKNEEEKREIEFN